MCVSINQILLKMWKEINYAAIDLKPDMIIQHEDFCKRPQLWAMQIYDKLDIDLPEFDYSFIHEPNKPYDLENEQWEIALTDAKIDKKYVWFDWEKSEESKNYLKTG